MNKPITTWQEADDANRRIALKDRKRKAVTNTCANRGRGMHDGRTIYLGNGGSMSIDRIPR